MAGTWSQLRLGPLSSDERGYPQAWPSLGAGGSSAPFLVPGLQSPGSWRFQPTPADSWPHTPHLLAPSGPGTPPDTGLPPHRGPEKKKGITSLALRVMQEVGRASPRLAESDFINTSLP